MNADYEIRLDKLLNQLNQTQRIMDTIFKDYNNRLGELFENFNKKMEIAFNNINIDFSQSLSDSLQRTLKSFQPIIHELEELQFQGSEIVPEETAEKTAEFIENTTNSLEEKGVESSKIQELSTIKNKKSFTTSEIIGIIIAFSELIFTIAGFFKKDITVNNYNQNITINYSNNQEQNYDSSILDETDINQICDDLSTWLDSLSTWLESFSNLQENYSESEKDPENADSPLPDAKVANDIQETTEISTQDNH